MSLGAPARVAWVDGRPSAAAPHPVDAACIAPWVSLEFDPQGWVYTCCANQTYPLGRIGDERLADLWAGDRARVLRETLGRWDLSAGCMSCRWHLEHGRVDTDAAVYDRYRLDGSEPAGPASMTFALSNRCNLACVMCNGELSSTIRHAEGRPPLPSRYDDQFFDDLVPFLGGLQYAKFLGGEPFLIPEHERVWRLMAEAGAPTRLQVTTNGTVWTDRVEWLLDRFDVDVTVSIDAHSAAGYERVRRGADHAALLVNVDRFARYAADRGTELRFCFCLMDHNADELAPFLRWADDLDVPVSVNVVSDTGLALHDLDADALAAVDGAWAAAEALHPGLASGRNAPVWATQREQLRTVLAERRGGIAPSPRQAQPAPAALLGAGALAALGASGSVGADPDAVDVADERRRLAAWSGGEVAELTLDAAGTITAVASTHGRLAIDASLVGRSADELVGHLAAADGRAAWIIDVSAVGPTVVRTLVLAADAPTRGSAGSVVRTVGWSAGAAGGSTLLVAEDRIHERSASTPVTITNGPA